MIKIYFCKLCLLFSLLSLLSINFSTGYHINLYPFILGNYILKSSNDPKIMNKYTYLIINMKDEIKLKTIDPNGIFTNKISRSCIFKNIKNHRNIFNNKKYDNVLTMTLQYNIVNKYSYSFCGIEIPEFRYEQITNYKPNRKIRVLHKANLLYILDLETDYYYLFDSNNVKSSLPYKEISLFSLMLSQILSQIISDIINSLINNHYIHKN